MDILLYGSYGFTGNLIAELAVQRGLRPVLGGRDAGKLRRQAERLGLQSRPFALDDPAAAERALAGIGVVLHCAGPFSRTSRPMADACLRSGAHYIDITGEIDVFEALAGRDAEARAVGVMLLPGAGFDVVPSDCLALYLKGSLPTADHLTLAIFSITTPSHGTARSSIERIDSPSLVRRDGRLIPIPAGSLHRDFDFGRGPKPTVAVAWGDLSTAWRSTAIPNIETFMALPPLMQRLLRLSRKFGSLLKTAPAQGLMKAAIRILPEGPNLQQRQNGLAVVYGEARDADGQCVAARVKTLEPYALTARTALLAAEKALSGTARPGYQTPATAFGEDFILEIEGCERTPVPALESR